MCIQHIKYYFIMSMKGGGKNNGEEEGAQFFSL